MSVYNMTSKRCKISIKGQESGVQWIDGYNITRYDRATIGYDSINLIINQIKESNQKHYDQFIAGDRSIKKPDIKKTLGVTLMVNGKPIVLEEIDLLNSNHPIDFGTLTQQYNDQTYTVDIKSIVKKYGAQELYLYARSYVIAGTCNENSDCLWHLLCKNGLHRYYIGGYKFFLQTHKLKAKEPIPLSKISNIENKIHCGIRVHDAEDNVLHQANPKFALVIDVKYHNGHYDKGKQKNHAFPTYHQSDEERPIVIVNKIDENNYEIYDGDKKTNIIKEDYDNLYDIKCLIKIEPIIKSMPDIEIKCDHCNQTFKKSKYVKHRKDNGLDYKIYEYSIEDVFKFAVQEYDKIKKYSQGEINPYRLGGWSNKLVKYYYGRGINGLLGDLTMPIAKEAQWLNFSVIGPYIKCYKKGKIDGPIQKIDQRSSFPFVLSDKLFHVPITSGIFKKITDVNFQKAVKTYRDNNKSISYGIYRVIVAYDDFKTNFRYNRKCNLYTSIDVMHAIKLGLDVHVIEDDNDNFLAYPTRETKDSIQTTKSAYSLFGKYIERIYNIKMEHGDCRLAKLMISSLHGILMESKKSRKITGKYDEDGNMEIEIEQDDVIDKITGNDKEIILDVKSYSDFFTSPLSRIKPFMYSQQRKVIREMLLDKYQDRIIRIHTDGWLMTGKLPVEFEGENKEIGKMHFEESYENGINIRGLNDYDIL